MKFTDSEGREWEEVPQKYKEQDHLAIRPVKQEPKWLIHETDKNYIKIELFGNAIDQAQLIKEAVEALMGQILSDTDRLVLIDAITDARQSMRENN